jgi:hypothetical protein
MGFSFPKPPENYVNELPELQVKKIELKINRLRLKVPGENVVRSTKERMTVPYLLHELQAFAKIMKANGQITESELATHTKRNPLATLIAEKMDAEAGIMASTRF